MVEVELAEGKSRDPFLSTLETLSRIGIHIRKDEDPEDRTLYQTCHILHKAGRYYIVHFKHLFMLDGKINGFYREDILRMNQIIRLLADWGLYTIKHPEQMTDFAGMNHIKVVKHGDVSKWKLVPKYRMQHKRKRTDLNRKD
ncbi:translation repressor [Erwinia phage vB_EamM-Bue1]|uniref:Translation repressor protein n=2 Tax=Nezavisimistyvirus TaxID=2841279 RepID=A0A0A0YVI9_9CAUD|nr:translation repressor [Erwinia phage phiEa2809]YP_009837709.1 translation repressor [Erwinia phage vB_EamM-Bue1]AIX13101.1 endoribonulcease translational repressor of early genes RegA [Erwinia phage phiEa2809]AVO22947.1 endoribonuclease [Erwinia phage vB_EamM-Bue1]